MKEFSSITLYEHQRPHQLPTNEADWQERLAEYQIVPLGRQDSRKIGFAPLVDDRLVVFSEGLAFIKVDVTERQLSGSAIGQAVKEKVAEIEKNENCKLPKRRRDEIRENLIQEILPHQLPLTKSYWVYVNVDRGQFIFSTATPGIVDDCIKLLRKALGGLPVLPPESLSDPRQLMTEWFKREKGTPEGFELDGDVLLKNPTHNAWEIKGKSLGVDDFSEDRLDTLEIRQVALHAPEWMWFVLKDNLTLVNITWLLPDDRLEDIENAEDEHQKLIAELYFFRGFVDQALPPLFAALQCKGWGDEGQQAD